jgi:hypothetical protein
MLRVNTNIRGSIALSGDNGEIKGIDWSIAHVKKYIFAYLRNCNISENGRNVIRLYLVVET